VKFSSENCEVKYYRSETKPAPLYGTRWLLTFCNFLDIQVDLTRTCSARYKLIAVVVLVRNENRIGERRD